jgi:predicted transcriptional regulator
MATYRVEHGRSYLTLGKRYDLWGLPLNKKYRSHFEIMALMLEAVKENREARFHIMKHAGINCTQLRRFLDSLVGMGFVNMEMKDGKILYKASERGLAFLEQYHVLLGMLLTAHSRSRYPSIGL